MCKDMYAMARIRAGIPRFNRRHYSFPNGKPVLEIGIDAEGRLFALVITDLVMRAEFYDIILIVEEDGLVVPGADVRYDDPEGYEMLWSVEGCE